MSSPTPPFTTRRRRALATAAAVLLAPVALLLAAGSGTAAASGYGVVTLVHGIKGLNADVSLDGDRVLSDFQYQNATGAIKVPAGRHHVQIYDTDKSTTKPALDTHVTIKPNENLTAVAAIVGGKPSVLTFDNDLPAAMDKTGAVVLRNAAKTGPVTASVTGGPKAGGTSTGSQTVSSLRAGKHRVTVYDSRGNKIGSTFGANIPVGRMLSVFVVGQPTSGSAQALSLVTAQQKPGGAEKAVKKVGTGGTPPLIAGVAYTLEGVGGPATGLALAGGGALLLLLALTYGARRGRPAVAPAGRHRRD